MTVMSRRALGRATLARQLLLQRSTLSVLDAVEHLVGLQAQTPQTWYVGLQSRLEGVRPETVSDLLGSRQLVRMGLMRSTIHLVTAEDAVAIRPVLDPVMKLPMSNFAKNLVGLQRSELARVGRDLLESDPMTFSELGRAMSSRWPERDPASLAQVVRAYEALVQVPPRGLWQQSGAARHTSLQSWLGRELGPGMSVQALVLRYLRAFGPASVKDAQTWCGLTRLAEVVDRLRPQLLALRDEDGRELFDLPDAPRPDEDVPAPVRLLYDFDNLLLSHADRTRFITPSAQAQGFDPHGPMPRMVLIDGVTAGVWTHQRSKQRAMVTIRGFDHLSPETVSECEAQAVGLLDFLEPDCPEQDVRVVPG
uniref:Winged helix DNA-binding domain-containing protein n=1 Tax=uncultured Nocardioidaceae bacterium TaxID=253824 RepID=A0A6J4LRG3_9ACTN|nr:MAG: FIG01121759: hypothetical protein [uncultured Nocardioidaceae bacterium]